MEGPLFSPVQTLSNSNPYGLSLEANSHVRNCPTSCTGSGSRHSCYRRHQRSPCTKMRLDDFQNSFQFYTCVFQGPINYFCSTHSPIQPSLSIPTAKALVQPIASNLTSIHCFHTTPPYKNLHWLTPPKRKVLYYNLKSTFPTQTPKMSLH